MSNVKSQAKTKPYERVLAPIKGHGGKHYMADKIIKLLPPRNSYLTFVDAMCRTSAVLLAHDPEGKSEVANDLDHRIANLWFCLQSKEHFDELYRLLTFTLFSEEQYEKSKKFLADGFRAEEAHRMFANDEISVQYAHAYFVVARQSLAGRETSFAPITTSRTRRQMNEQVAAWLTAIDNLPKVHERISRVLVTCRDVFDLIPSLDGPNTVQYLDPPYHPDAREALGVYGEYEWDDQRHRDLLTLIKSCQSKFLLSGYSVPLYDEELKHWHREDRELPNNASGSKTKKRMTECIWTNYTPC